MKCYILVLPARALNENTEDVIVIKIAKRQNIPLNHMEKNSYDKTNNNFRCVSDVFAFFLRTPEAGAAAAAAAGDSRRAQ